MLQQRGGVTLDDADTIKLPNIDGMYLKAIRWADETAGGTGGYLYFMGKGDDRKYRFGKNKLVGDLLVGEIEFPDGVFPMPKGQRIRCVGDASGAGAEQHVVLLDIWNPSLPNIEIFKNESVSHIHRLGKKTGTLTAATPSGLGNILTGFEDSEIQLPETAEDRYVLTRLGNYPGLAGVGVCGVRHQNGLFDRLFPTIYAAAVKGIDYPIGWVFSGESPPLLVGAGVVTTSTEFTVEIAKV